MGEEFKSTVDFCVEADIPFPVKDFVAVDSDSYPPLFIMVGPVPISIGKSIFQKITYAMLVSCQ